MAFEAKHKFLMFVFIFKEYRLSKLEFSKVHAFDDFKSMIMPQAVQKRVLIEHRVDNLSFNLDHKMQI